jgi:hypothetical protein
MATPREARPSKSTLSVILGKVAFDSNPCKFFQSISEPDDTCRFKNSSGTCGLALISFNSGVILGNSFSQKVVDVRKNMNTDIEKIIVKKEIFVFMIIGFSGF